MCSRRLRGLLLQPVLVRGDSALHGITSVAACWGCRKFPTVGHAALSQQAERVIVRSLVAGSPAYGQGVNGCDWIAAINGVTGPVGFIQTRIDEKKPGDVVRAHGHLVLDRAG